MSWGAIFLIFIVVAHIALIILLLISMIKKTNEQPKTPDGKNLVCPSKTLFWGAMFMFLWALIGAYMFIEAIFREKIQSTGVLIGLLLMVSFTLLGRWILLRYLNYKIVWDDKGLEVTNWRGKKTKYKWRDLESHNQNKKEDHVRFYNEDENVHLQIRFLDLKFSNGDIVRTAPNLHGYYNLVKFLKQLSTKR